MKWSATDWMMIIITCTVCYVIAMAVTTPLIDNVYMNDAQTKEFVGVVLALIAIVSYYAGSKNRNNEQ